MRDPDARPVFCIVDPSLRDFVGHHFSYDASVAEAAEAAGFRAVALGPRDAIPEIRERLRVEPVFRRDIWGKHPLSKPFRGLAQRVVDHALCIRDFAADLRRGLAALDLPPGSVILGHMITAKHLPGFASELARLPRGGRDVTAILLLRYQPFFYDNPIGARAFRKLEALAARGQRIRIASDSLRLAEQIGRLTSLPVEVLPIPHTPPEATAPRAPGARIRFASLGGARDEKGYVEILDAIRLLREEREGLAGLDFVLQSNDAAPDVQAAIDDFAGECPAEVTLLRSALDEAAYTAALHATDVVLLPYWRSIYEARTSGVFLEALAAGKPVIATADTWMSDELALHGAGILVPDRDPAALAVAIRDAARDHATLAAKARAERTAVLARHSAAALVTQCMGEAPPPRPPRPVRRVAMFYPWDDLRQRRGGASLRCNLLLDVIAPRVEAVEVLQTGYVPPVQRGNIRIETAPLRLRHTLLRRTFRLLTLPFLGRADFGQGLPLWWHFERLPDPGFRARVRDMVRRADVVLLEYSFWGRVVQAACRAYRVPCILTQHDVLAQQVTRSALIRRWTMREEVRALRAADHAVCVAPTDAAVFRERGVAARVIENPIDLDRAMAAAPPQDARMLLRLLYGILPSPGPVALFVGSKHPPNLAAVERLRALAKQRPGIAFVVAGSVAAPGRAGNLLTTGPVEDAALSLLYHLASLVLIPLESGSGSSLKTVEAMAAGRPVLGTSVAFRGMAVRAGEDCVIEDDLARWPEAIAALLADPARAAAMGAAGQRVAQAYDHRRVYAGYDALLGLPPLPAPDPVAGRQARERRFALDLAGQALSVGRVELAQGLIAALPPGPGGDEGAPLLAIARSALEADRPDLAAEMLDRAQALAVRGLDTAA